MDKPMIILDPVRGGEREAYYDLANGVRLAHGREEFEALAEEGREYLNPVAGRRWRSGELEREPRYCVSHRGRRLTWGDPGAVAVVGALAEKDVTLDVARSVRRELPEGLVSKSTRERDGYVSEARRSHLAERAVTAARSGAVVLRLTAPAADVHRYGAAVVCPEGGEGASLGARLAVALEAHLGEEGHPGAEVELREEPRPRLLDLGVPAVEVELGYLSHPVDCERLGDRRTRRRLAAVLAAVLAGHFGVGEAAAADEERATAALPPLAARLSGDSLYLVS